MPNSTAKGDLIRKPKKPCSNFACFCAFTIKGEPSLVQIEAYLAADFLGRITKIIQCKIQHQIKRGISTMRLSIKNCPK